MIIKAKHHFFIYPFFKYYTLRIIKRNFHAVKINGRYEDKDLPVLVVANHISWWDGFWLMYVNLKLLHRRFHFMMLEDQLRKHWYFNYSGGYSIRKKSRGIIESLRYSAELLQSPRNMVLMFPQGEFRSLYEQKAHFNKGIERILHYCKNNIQIIFVANLVDYFSHQKPVLFINIDEYQGESKKIKDIEMSYNDFYTKAISSQIKNAQR